MYYTKREDDLVQCNLCPRNCIIKEDDFGLCHARKNVAGKLMSMVYARPVAMHVDPIEKKPLFHFYPGKDILSIGPVGCNLMCQHCQNWQIARGKPDMNTETVSPEKVVEAAIAEGCSMIAYTYTEPTIFFEYVLDIAKLAKERGLKNVIVSNGFINEEPLKEILPYVDGANIDLKGFSEEFYKRVCFAQLRPVLDTIKIIAESDAWLEITNLIIPGHNDQEEMIEKMCKWIAKEAGSGTPLHLSRFFPHHKMSDIKPTPPETMIKAQEIGKEYLKYVYIGNMVSENSENTYCPKCKKLAIGRSRFGILVNKLKDGKCFCGEDIPGRWN